MSNTTYRYLYIKDVVPVNEYSWNPTARYLIHPKSKYGGYALKFQDLIDRAISYEDLNKLRRLMTSEPDLSEFEKISDLSLQTKVLRSIKTRERDSYALLLNDKLSEKSMVHPIEILSRTRVVSRVANGRETRPHVVKHVESMYPEELTIARDML